MERIKPPTRAEFEAAPTLNKDQIRALYDRIDDLEEGIRNHRDQKGDDRCWIDDNAIYALVGGTANTALPPKEEFLQNCARFHASRQNPQHIYETVEQQMAPLRKQLAVALHLIEKRCGLHRGEGWAQEEDFVGYTPPHVMDKGGNDWRDRDCTLTEEEQAFLKDVGPQADAWLDDLRKRIGDNYERHIAFLKSTAEAVNKEIEEDTVKMVAEHNACVEKTRAETWKAAMEAVEQELFKMSTDCEESSEDPDYQHAEAIHLFAGESQALLNMSNWVRNHKEFKDAGKKAEEGPQTDEA